MAGPLLAAAIVGGISLAGSLPGILSARTQRSREKRRADLQAQIDSAKLNFEAEQDKTRAQLAAEQNANNFRRALASQTALAGARDTVSSGFAQTASESMSNFLQDQATIKRGINLAELGRRFGETDIALRRNAQRLNASNMFARTVTGALTQAGLAAFNSYQFGASGGSGSPRPAGTG